MRESFWSFSGEKPQPFPISLYIAKTTVYWIKHIISFNPSVLQKELVLWSIAGSVEVGQTPPESSLPESPTPGFPSGSVIKSCLQCEKHGLDPWVGQIPWRRKWQPTPLFLPGKFRGQRSLQVILHGVSRVRHHLVIKQEVDNS